MHRILLGMAIGNYLLLTATMYLGLLSESRGQSHPAGELFHYHLSMGLLTALFTMLTHSLVFTYFLGTTRWVRETSAAYSLPRSFAERSQACRRKAFAMVVTSILLVVAVVATGAGADTRTWPLWLHQIVPAAVYSFLLWAYLVEYRAIETHTELTDDVMVAVNQIRRDRGLE